MSTQELDVNFSLSGLLFGWLLLTLFFGSFIYSFIVEILPLSEPNLTHQQVLLLRFLWVLWIPFVTFFFLLGLLPFEPIDFSFKAILQSVLHKILFLCTSPIILIGYFIAQGFVDGSKQITLSGLGFIFYWIFTWPFVILWCIISLLLWELFAGKNASSTIKRFRSRNKKLKTTSYGMSWSQDAILKDIVNNNYKSSQVQLNQSLPISRRWFVFSVSLPIFSIYLGTIIDPSGTLFFFKFFVSLGVDLFFIPIASSFYKKILIQKNYSLNFMNKIESSLFGTQDISPNAVGLGLGSLFIIFVFISSAQIFIPHLIYKGIFLIMIFICILTIWNNQFKTLFSKIF